MYFILYEFIMRIYFYSSMNKNYEEMFKLNVYNKHIIDRYIIYLFSNFILSEKLHFLVCIPNIQDFIPVNVGYIFDNFFKFLFFKNMTKITRELHSDIVIHNHCIKTMIDNFIYDDIYTLMKTFATIKGLKNLKHSRYALYKAVKFLYYFETNDLYKDLSIDDSVKIINNEFNNITRDSIKKLEFVGAVYSITRNKKIILYFLYYKFFKTMFILYICIHSIQTIYIPIVFTLIMTKDDFIFYIKHIRHFLKNEKK